MAVFGPGKCNLAVSSERLNYAGAVGSGSVGSRVGRQTLLQFSPTCFGCETGVCAEQD